MEKIQLENLTEEQISMHLILHSGSARSKVIQALRQYGAGKEAESKQLIEEAEADLQVAHHIHFQMVEREAKGEKNEFSMLLVHAEDHLMSTLTMKDLIKEMIEVFKMKNI